MRNRGKFNAVPTEVDGIKFASKKEAARYIELKAMEKAGEIQGLQRQVEYLLIPDLHEPDTIGPRGGIRKGKLIERGIRYKADFVYTKDHETIVEDVKGRRTKEYIMKRKMMRHILGIIIKEV